MRTKQDVEDRVAIMQAWLDGKAIQYRVSDDEVWGDFDPGVVPRFMPSYDYRLRPTIQDSIDWSHVAPRFKFMARDGDGKAYLFVSEPILRGSAWHPSLSCGVCDAAIFTSYTQGETSWKDSIVRREEATA